VRVHHIVFVHAAEVLAIAHLSQQKRVVLEHELWIGVVHMAHLCEWVLVEAVQSHHTEVVVAIWHFHGVVVKRRVDVVH
jgi:multidrug transporter EmrE-like cation transporter